MANTPYLTFTSASDFSVGYTQYSTKAPTITLEYSTDLSTWATMILDTPISVTGGNSLYIRGNGNTSFTIQSSGYYHYNNFTMSGSGISISGNIMSLLDYSTYDTIALAKYCFYSLFRGLISITDASELVLPATTLTSYCYYGLFYGCTSLINPPAELPATTLASYCYGFMFHSCSALTSLPDNFLPATTLASNCYYGMFQNCTGLTSLPENLLPATTLVAYCYVFMFRGCAGLISLPSNLLPATTLTSECYHSMFRDCTSLTSLPDLPATALDTNCYFYMFYGCGNLKVNTEKADECTKPVIFLKDVSGRASTYASQMFADTGGTFTGTPELNTTYYISQDYSVTIDGYKLQPLKVGDKEYTIDKIIVKDGGTELIYPVK